MMRQVIQTKWLAVGALMGLVYLVWPDSSTDSNPTHPHARLVEAGGHGLPSGSHTVSNSFPWLNAADTTGTASPQAHDRLLALLDEYQQGGGTPDRKRAIRMAFAAAKQDPVARGILIEWFWGARDPQRALAVYGLMRDSDFKDQTLIEALIERDAADAEVVVKQRLIDLIADHNAVESDSYSPAIDAYLDRLSRSTDDGLRQAAASQRIWYVAQRKPDQLASLAQLLGDSSPAVREDMYAVLESRLGSPVLRDARADLVLILTELDKSPERVISEFERARMTSLLAALNRP